MAAWDLRLHRDWPGVHIGEPNFVRADGGWDITVPVYLGDIAAIDIRVECFADPVGTSTVAEISGLVQSGPIRGATSGYAYCGHIQGTRPADHYTVRVVPSYPGVRVPGELSLIRWQR
jgi:starch phosphorylase